MRSYVPLLLVGLLVLLLTWLFPDALKSDEDKADLIQSVVLLMVIGSAVVVRMERGRTADTAKALGIWAAVFIVAVAGYAYRDAIFSSRFMAELLPGKVQINGDGTLTVHAREGGHFFIQAQADGKPVQFMVDTGATDIVLAPDDARKLGIDVEHLKYYRRYNTANGMGLGASAELRELKVGNVTLKNVPVSVNRTEMDDSLLGMAFLKRFSRYEVRGNVLTLVP
jgi:aspartyl protease family protein